MNCTNQQPPQHDGAVPNPNWVGLKWLLAFPKVSVFPGTLFTQTISSPCCPVNHRRRVAHSFFKSSRLSSLFSCVSLAHLLILLLLVMNGNIHPNPCPAFPCSVCAGNVTWRSRSVQSCAYSEWVHLKCSLLSFSIFKTFGSSRSESYVPAFSGDPTPTSTMTSSLDSSSWYTSIAQSGPPLLMQHSCPNLAFKPLIFFPPTSYILPLHHHHRLMLLVVSLYLLLPLLLFDFLVFFSEILGVSERGALSGYTLVRLIPLVLFVSRNLTLTYLPLSGSLGSLLCDLIAPTPGLIFFLLISHMLVVASSFSSGMGRIDHSRVVEGQCLKSCNSCIQCKSLH